MDYKAAIAKLQADSPELAEIIAAYVGSINQESANRRVELRDSLAVIEALKKIAGDDADLVEFATSAKKKADAGDGAIADLQAKLDAALLLVASEQRSSKIFKAAKIASANENALADLLKDIETEQIQLTETDVKVAGKTLKEFAEETKAWMIPSLFPTPQNEALPTGGATPQEPVLPASSYLSNKAAGLAKSLGITQ
jgi:hypothetical protein